MPVLQKDGVRRQVPFFEVSKEYCKDP